MRRIARLCALTLPLCIVAGCSGQHQDLLPQRVDNRLHISDLGNGFYKNPILHIDYSDPDVVAVDGHYYMTASSFNARRGYRCCIPQI